MAGAPLLLLGQAAVGPRRELLAACGEQLAALVEEDERVGRVAAQVADRGLDVGAGGREGLAVGRDLVFEALAAGAQGPLAHHRAADDERRPLRLGVGRVERRADGVDVVAVDLDDMPVPRLVLHADVLRVYLVDGRRELDVVGVVVHDEVREAQVTGDAAHALRDLLLHGAVRDVGVGLVRHPLAEARRHEPLDDRGAERHRVALAQRARGVLHAAQHVDLGVSRRHAAPLAQRLQVVDRVVAGHGQHGIEHRRHVARVEEEAVAVGVVHAPRIVAQVFGVEHRHEVGAAHRTAGVARFRLFDHCGRQDADVVGYARDEFGIGWHIGCLIEIRKRIQI